MVDTDRFAPEPDKNSWRSSFERDRARVLHSAGFRRLAAKTQVHTAGTDDFLRTRLTHSLEVAQIAREMGARLGCDPDVVDVAGLAHDLGHPPFGHNGEDALNDAAEKCGGFEGNAQTLRVLTRLEAKVEGAGLNLTRASLDATCKYPWPRVLGRRKFGVYADDMPVFEWIRQGRPADSRCLEAQVMDWADDVAYSVHDVEDGFFSGFIDLSPLLNDTEERRALCADVAQAYSSSPVFALESSLEQLLADPTFAQLAAYDGSFRAQIALKHFTSTMTGRFVAAAVNSTREAFGDAPLRRYDADLVVPTAERAYCALLKGIALRYVMRRRGTEPWYAEQRQILTDLVEVLCERAPSALDQVFAPLWKDASDDAARLRVVIDQVASLTDPAAIAWHRRLLPR
ncbi:deoxyguanosinetriphosphate triphosphohydrolase-like protein [Rhizocola hellebori]|uniref:Deoxyguanosinetriphosphate triphosphohydrolase-like protein n=1 Tax=Rhizocola hellebori TaxID=1392758 RepID=A0A8J3Q3T9_9ACTN|nr:deoxyguanosinetriphosphate triphosphohydrolase [Rhizocola hellebori]GIH03239.1 deoxyguanosinetriphosphate triphosphohydrolase-like protein [Rhizocola hellebori]